MTSFLSSWVLRLVGAAAVSAAAASVAPKGKTKAVVRLVCGALMVAALLGVAADIDPDAVSDSAREYSEQAEEAARAISERNDSITAAIIEETSAAYILDKGRQLGADVSSASVRAVMEDGQWRLKSASVRGTFTQTQREELSLYMSGELGIDTDLQEWLTDDGGGAD